MQSLPPPIVDVTVPDCFSPSAVWSSNGCALKLIISSLRRTEWLERLATGPEAAVGTLLHRMLERACREADSVAEDIFEDTYARLVGELSLDPRRAHFADLASTKPPAEWSRLRSWVLSRARALQPRHVSADRPRRAETAQRISGAEILLESATLRLRGRADRVRQLAPRLFEIRDFKTGATIDEEGAIKPEIALQLQAYGLLLLERRRGVEVRLVVDDGTEREVAFDQEAQQTAKDALKRITGPMPAAGHAATSGLARPGAACWGCAVRHVCPAYRATAPGWWKAYPVGTERLSNDVWGTVLEVLGSGRVDVVLRDDAGRRVRVNGIGERHGISSSSVGSRLWFFGLEATGASRGFDGVRFHPRSFHELPRDRSERRAWALNIFVENGRSP